MRPFVALEKPMRLIIGTGSSEEPRLPPGYSLGSLRPRCAGFALPQRDGGRPLQRPGRHDGGHRTGGEDAL